MSPRFTVAGVVAIAAAALLGVSPVARGASSPPNKTDAAEYARAVGVTEAEASRRLDLQGVVGDLSATLREREPDFAGLYIDHLPTYRVVVLFTKGGPPILAPYLAGSQLESIVQVQNATFSLSELEADRRSLGLKLEGTALAVDLNTKANRVEVQVPPGSDLRSQGVSVDDLPATATVVAMNEVRTPSLNLYGGLTLTSCTSGFTIYYGVDQSNRGLTTAGHCSNAQSYAGNVLTYQNDEQAHDDYDAQSYKRAGAAFKNWIQDSVNGNTRSITGKRLWVNQNVGDFVCHYGLATHYGCGYITSLYDGGCLNPHATFNVHVHEAGLDLSNSGDSGGPWFIGGIALGNMSCQQGDDGIYSSVGFTEGGLHAKVLINP